MTKTKIVLAAVVALPMLAFNLPAFAAAAHNLETGADNSNANTTPMKKMSAMHMKKMHKKMHKAM